MQCVKPDITIGTESWLTKEISDNEAFSPQVTEKYECHRNDRQGKFPDKESGGGVFVLAHKRFTSWIHDKDKEAELLWIGVQMATKKPPCYFGSFYRPEHTDVAYLDHLDSSLKWL